MTLPALARRKSNPGRVYTHPLTDEQVPSVTNITGHKDKSGALVGWAVKHTANAAVKRFEELVELAKEDPQYALKILNREYGTKTARSRVARELKGARFEDKVPGTEYSPSELGTLIHQAVEDDIHGRVPMLPRGGEGYFRQWQDFQKRFQVDWRLVEATVWNRTLGYAGTLDLGGVFRNGRFYLIDIKTGNGVYPEYAMQLEALSRAEFILTTEGEELPIPEIHAMGILHLQRDFWELHEVKRNEMTWAAFLGLLEVRKWDQDAASLVLGARVKGTADEEAA